MKKCLATAFALSVFLLCGFAGAQEKKAPVKHTVPPPIHAAKGVICSPWNKDHLKFPRGLKKTPCYKLALAKRFDPLGIKVPAQVLMLPKQLSMWGNDQYGDCVSASEAARIAAYSVFCGLPETFIPEATLIAWAQKGGYLDGADLTDVMTDRQTRGMADANGKLFLAGPYTSVNFSDEPTLQAALALGPVNFGIDADALPSGAGNGPGWYAFGGTPGQFSNEDHCTPSFGFVTGPMSAATAFAAISQAYGVTVAPPANAPTGTVYLWFTWNTVGVVDHPWIMSTAGEAWLQNPTTVGQSPSPSPPTPNPPTPPSGIPADGPYNLVTNADGTRTLSAYSPPVQVTNGSFTYNADGTITLTPTAKPKTPVGVLPVKKTSVNPPGKNPLLQMCKENDPRISPASLQLILSEIKAMRREQLELTDRLEAVEARNRREVQITQTPKP